MTNNLSSKGPSLVAKMMVSNSKINSGACRLPLTSRGLDGEMQNRPGIRHQGAQCEANHLPRGYDFPSESSKVSVGVGVGRSSLHCTEQTPKPL